MTTIGYVFLDADRTALISLELQRHVLEAYADGLNLSCDELLVEESYSAAVPFQERTEGARMLDHVQSGDTILVMQAKWIFGSPKSALSLIEMLKEKNISLYCQDLDGNVTLPTQRKLISSQGIASIVYQLCEALSVGDGGTHGAAIRAGKARLKKDGKYIGGPVPFGWLVGEDGKLHKDLKQQGFIDKMIELKADRWSYRDIAIIMKEKHDLHLSHEGIRRIVLKHSRQN